MSDKSSQNKESSSRGRLTAAFANYRRNGGDETELQAAVFQFADDARAARGLLEKTLAELQQIARDAAPHGGSRFADGGAGGAIPQEVLNHAITWCIEEHYGSVTRAGDLGAPAVGSRHHAVKWDSSRCVEVSARLHSAVTLIVRYGYRTSGGAVEREALRDVIRTAVGELTALEVSPIEIAFAIQDAVWDETPQASRESGMQAVNWILEELSVVRREQGAGGAGVPIGRPS